MASINKIDLSSITNNSSDVYDIDATTLDGSSISDFAFLDGENHFTGSENYFTGDLLRVVSPSESDLISLWTDGDGLVMESVIDANYNLYSRLQINYSNKITGRDETLPAWRIGTYNDVDDGADGLEINASMLLLAAEAIEVFGEINAKDFGVVWTLPGTAYIGEGIRFSTFDKGGTISAVVKGDPYDETGILNIDAGEILQLAGGQGYATIGLSIVDDTDNMSAIELSAENGNGDCGWFRLTSSQSRWGSDEISIEVPYAGIHLCNSEITLDVDRTAELKVMDSQALMRADTKVEIYSNKDNARLEITPNEIRIHNKAYAPADPIRLLYVGGGDLDELHVYCETYFREQPIYYGPSSTKLDHRYVRYGKLHWSEFITQYITDSSSTCYEGVEIEINTILGGGRILDGVDSYWIPLREFRDSKLFFRAALLDQKWLGEGIDGHTVSGMLLQFSGSSIKPRIIHSDFPEDNSLSVYSPDNTSDQYIYYRVYDIADYPLARDEEWSMSF